MDNRASGVTVGVSRGLPVGDDVHVWHGLIAEPPGETSQHAGAEAELAVLSGGERARSQRFLRPADRWQFVAAHAAVRRVLGSYVGADPAAIRMGRTPCCRCGSTEHGRPRIEWPATPLDYNFSGSGRHWVLAVAQGRPVGVDVEVRRGIDVVQMSQTCLTGSERSYLTGQPAVEQLGVFFRCWTRKEAVLKACGVGLASTLSSLEVEPQRRPAVRVRHASGTCPDAWLVQDLPGGPDWSAAVAQPASHSGTVVVREYAPS